MSKLTKLLVCLSILIVGGATQVNVVCPSIHLSGYYWRDYSGTIPNDAIKATEKPSYIGQTVYQKIGVMVPGRIDQDVKKMFFEFDSLEHSTAIDVKILCSQNPERFHWIQARQEENVSGVIKDKELIIGGHRTSQKPVAIGRTYYTAGEVLVGKLLIHDDAFERIYVSKNGKAWAETKFEVLVYDENGEYTIKKDKSNHNCQKNIYINIH